MILEKIRNKNNQSWSLYDGKIPVTSFNAGLKRES